MKMIRSTNIKDIWESSIESVLSEGKDTEKCIDKNSIGSYFGTNPRYTKEILASQVTLTNPRERILQSDIRKINYSYLFANFLFLFSKENTVDFIEFYNNNGRNFTDNGKTFNAPLGYRINRHTQIQKIASLIIRDSTTRRAIIQIFDAEDLGKESRDIPCVNYFQLLNRNNKLFLICNMRSQSVFSIMPYDIFLFSLFQEAVACFLKIELGDYIHFSGSFHIYDDEFVKANRVVNEREANSQNNSFEMRSMENFNDKILKELFKAEQDVRRKIKNKDFDSINFEKYNIDNYWKTFLRVMFNAFLHPELGISNVEEILKMPCIA